MKAAIACFVILTAIFGGQASGAKPSIALVPQPSRIVRGEGAFTLTADTKILVDKDSTDAADVGKQLAERIFRSTGLKLRVLPEATATGANTILLTTQDANPALGTEGYTLETMPGAVVIRAAAGPGLFYATQTLLQLLPTQIFSPTAIPIDIEGKTAWSVPAVTIDDRPRFRWRGLMLDVSRHFFNKDEVKNFIDFMAQHKMNTFHWHLVDSQGWRLEIKRYPKLTEVGAWRKDILFGPQPQGRHRLGTGRRYGGFYTQDDVREIVAYAKDRYVTIVPEIELPGHSAAALDGLSRV